MSETRTIQVQHAFKASAERVYDAFLTPVIARQFLFATPTGEMVKAEVDARVGGKFEFIDRRDGVDVLHNGEYLELESPRKLVFTFGVPMYSPVMTTVTIEIKPQGAGCLLTLTHEGVLPEWAEATQNGWAGILAKGDAVLGA